MPTYSYQCKKCGKNFTQVMRLSEHDKKKVTCPKCASKDVVQTVTAFYAKTSKKS